MATKKMYDKCVRMNATTGLRDLHTHSNKPNLQRLFGKKVLVNEKQLKSCSKAEYRRHLHEDRILCFLYIKNNSDGKLTVNYT